MSIGNKPEVVHSYLDDTGRWVDCIRTESQRGLQGTGVAAAPPPFIPMTGTAPSPSPAPPRRDRLGNLMVCPEGCIPVLRGEPGEPGNPGSSQRYFEKAPGGGALPPQP